MQDSKGRENEKVLGIPVSFPEFLLLQDILSVAEMVARTHLQCFPWPLCCQTWWSVPSLLNLIYHTVFDAGVCCIYFSIFLPWPLKDNTILVFVLPFSLLVPPPPFFFFLNAEGLISSPCFPSSSSLLCSSLSANPGLVMMLAWKYELWSEGNCIQFQHVALGAPRSQAICNMASEDLGSYG